MRHASKFAMDSSMVTRMCKLPEDIYSMLLICEAQDVVEAPLPLNPEENEVWVRGSCTWKVKARILDVATTDQCKDVLSKKHQQKSQQKHQFRRREHPSAASAAIPPESLRIRCFAISFGYRTPILPAPAT